jgi:hypothetical protein
MFDAVMTAGFENIDEADQVGIDVGVGILQRIAHTRLGSQIDHPLRAIPHEGFSERPPIFQVGMYSR